MTSWIKNHKATLLFVVLYLLLFIPNYYAIYYSVPASDDFAMSLGRDAYGNMLKEFFAAIPYYWSKRGGTMFSFLSEFIFNPLNLHRHLGHCYGIYMIIAFTLCMAGVLYGTKRVIEYMLLEDSSAGLQSAEPRYIKAGGAHDEICISVHTIASLATFITAVMLIENFYYVETYNWYVGMMAYAVPVACMFLTFGFIVRYANTGAKKYYVGMIICGVIAANTTALDVPLGIFFLYIVFFKKGFKPHSKGLVKDYLPLVLYVLVGVATVLAPGNFVRQGQYAPPSLSASLRVTLADIKEFGMAIIKERPVTLIVLAVLVLVGFASNSKAHKKPGNLIMFAIASVAAWFGSILPYVYGRGKTGVGLDVRIQYVLDYLIEISLCVGFFMLGQWLAFFIKKDLEKIGYFAATAVAVLGAAALIVTGRHQTTVSYDIYAKSPEIVNSYALWDGILTEIENSSEDDVVINRTQEDIDKCPWNRYFLYSGMEPPVYVGGEEGEIYAVPLDAFYDAKVILPNVYYKKKSIIVNYPKKF